MTQITLEKAQQDLPALIARVLAGEDIVIDVGGKMVRLAPVPPAFDEVAARRRGYGVLTGKLVVGPEFFEQISDEECGLGGERDKP